MQIITYSSEVAKPEWRWVAYIVLPNGEYLGVMFRADSEDAAKQKAEQFWQDESKRRIYQSLDIRAEQRAGCMEEGPVFKDEPHHMAGKVWVKNLTTGEKRRVLPDQISDLGSDWVRGGPRS